MFYFRLICVLRGSLHGDSDAALLRNSPESPQSATGILCNPLTMFARSSELGRSNLVKVLRRDGDSNPGNPFGVYTLSRRASSTTRASLLTPKTHFSGYPQRGFFKIGYKITTNYSYTQVFWQLFFILLHFFVDYLHISKKNTTFAPRINEKIVND